MLVLFDLLNGSYEFMILSIYLSFFFTLAIGTIVSYTLSYASSCEAKHTVTTNRFKLPASEPPIIAQVIHEQISWLQRTICRKDNSEDDHYLFIRS